MKIQPAVRQRRKEIRDEAKRILLGMVLYHPYFPHDIYINVSGIKEWLNQPHKQYAEKNEALLQLPELFLSSEYRFIISAAFPHDIFPSGHLPPEAHGGPALANRFGAILRQSFSISSATARSLKTWLYRRLWK